jgi:Dolichyl-phosphate-mannose-protein mannosyltransferase
MNIPTSTTTQFQQIRRSACCIIIPILLFCVLRFPTLVHQPGSQDEQWFAVPGLTVLREGIPRIPYLPTRRRETLFENADVCLMALPPGLFYTQAPFFAMFSPGYPTARIPLFIAALAAIALTYRVTVQLGGSPLDASMAAGILAISRPLMFTGLTARPDLLCILCGWIAILVVWKRTSQNRLRDSVLIGGICGLGALFHPFALVFCIQSAFASLFGPGTWMRRFVHICCMACGTLLTLGLWLPLIIAFPYEFRSQFFANVLDRAGPGLPVRLLYPFPSFVHHSKLLWEFAGTWQCLIMAAGLVFGSIAFWHQRRDRTAVGYIALAWSSIYLTAAVAGLHPTKGYWCYPFFWVIPLLVMSLRHVLTNWKDRTIRPRYSYAAYGLAIVSLFALMIPGSGLRTSWLYLSHWKDPRYHATTFIDGVLSSLPRDGVFYADLVYVFDIYLSGRETRLCQERTQYWGDDELRYRYLLLTWEGADAGWAKQYDAKLMKRIGSRDIDQSCFVDIYQPKEVNSP